ncbi:MULTISPECIES: hypothetical protein [unclassified Cryobacterium]|uniref:hypothetical protein n=1 Tax=unclassified Cryobacterium TaxID=2649013 RepID=UPI002AB54355|nr:MULTISPECIES: hypothetical protein [Cryobacterium]MDY7530040.1 hypothetical protein [Cryobacterium sp. 10C2]MDY7555312.1 hypothetical protein [Cryobacterium sp. 10C3]MEB0290595.1 hypothetical protein [Cryobacterium sp. 10C2]MEC5152617.1 hypothetical protein [Cryobacterium psychrotolerans]
MRTSNGGRKSKGARELLGTRPSSLLAEAARGRVDELGISMSDYLAILLAHDLGMPEYAPKTNILIRQMELPIADVA